MVRFSNDFEKSSFIERCAWKNFISLYDAFPGYEQMITPYEGSSIYDVMLYKLKDGIISDRVFIEIKVRDVLYDTLFLETKKYNSIKNMCEKQLYLKENEYKILYVNFCKNGTYIWNTDIVKELKVTKQEMNKATMNSKSDKIIKSKWDLPIDRAKKYNYIWDEKQLKKHYDEYFCDKVKKNIKGKGGLEDFLFMK